MKKSEINKILLSLSATLVLCGGGVQSTLAQEINVETGGNNVKALIMNSGFNLDEDSGNTITAGNGVTFTDGFTGIDYQPRRESPDKLISNNTISLDGVTLNGGTVNGISIYSTGDTMVPDKTEIAVNGNTLKLNNIASGSSVSSIRAVSAYKANNNSLEITNSNLEVTGNGIYVAAVNLIGNASEINSSASNNNVYINSEDLKIDNQINGPLTAVYYSFIGLDRNVELTNNSVVIDNIHSVGYVTGARGASYADGNSVRVKNTVGVIEDISGALVAQEKGTAVNNYVEIENGRFNRIAGAEYSSSNNTSATVQGNFVNFKGGTIEEGDSTDYYLAGGVIKTASTGDVVENYVNITGGTIKTDVYGGYNKAENGSAVANKVIFSSGTVNSNVYGGRSQDGKAEKNIVSISGGTYNNSSGYIYGGRSTYDNVESNYVEISGEAEITSKMIIGGFTSNSNGDEKSSLKNIVNITGGTVNSAVYGGYGNNNANVSENEVLLSGGTVNNNVYGGFSVSGTANNNKITLTGTADVSDARLYGANKTGQTGNTLTVDGWSGETQNVRYFNNIDFSNTEWNNGSTVLEVTNGTADALADTKVNLNNLTFDAGQELSVGDKKTFISSSANTGLKEENINESADFSRGVATVGKLEGSLEGANNDLVYRVASMGINPQTELVAESRAVAAAFINQGTDLISDSLDTLSRDGKYGVKTFAAVHGNRSKYDVNSDIKINGWSTIVGVGSETEHDGGDFSWGVFYENGSGNYRTYNSFNNEFFRGDGSLVYNGGGIAARYEQDNGVYTEGSLRAGMLKSDMDNALRDGKGNSYGYESESTYYGAHLGIGKIISLSDDSDLDIYGKFFHTYTDGDSFSVGDDKFEFDDITSDRLRVGARLTTNKENAFSTYYGLAYEYEFNGDADMKAAGMSAPTQSLQGSSYMAEIGLNYQPAPDSPWSFDLNMRGYTGERQGASFNVQATYTF